MQFSLHFCILCGWWLWYLTPLSTRCRGGIICGNHITNIKKERNIHVHSFWNKSISMLINNFIMVKFFVCFNKIRQYRKFWWMKICYISNSKSGWFPTKCHHHNVHYLSQIYIKLTAIKWQKCTRKLKQCREKQKVNQKLAFFHTQTRIYIFCSCLILFIYFNSIKEITFFFLGLRLIFQCDNKRNEIIQYLYTILCNEIALRLNLIS
jgi:hypothetical protein